MNESINEHCAENFENVPAARLLTCMTRASMNLSSTRTWEPESQPRSNAHPTPHTGLRECPTQQDQATAPLTQMGCDLSAS